MTAAPRGAIPNWQPATTLEDYVHNCGEGLEEYSERRAAKLLGWPRVRLFRARLMAEIPDDLFDRLLQAGVLSSKALASVSLALRRGNTADIERCPHCGGVVQVRQAVGGKARDVVIAWLSEQGGEPSYHDAITEVGKRVRAGEPGPGYLLPKRDGGDEP